MLKVRSSSRQTKLSSAFQKVDAETLRLATEQRLASLESDNYNEQEVTGEQDDDAYQSDDSDAPKRKKTKRDRGSGQKDAALKWMTRPVKSLERVLMDNGISLSSSAADITEDQSDSQQQQLQQQHHRTVNYFSINALPPRIIVKRPFCSVCGYLGDYSCTRCGARFCSLRCNESHQETRCLKVSI